MAAVCFLMVLESRKPQIQLLAGLVPGEGSLPDLQMAAVSLPSPGLCVHVERESKELFGSSEDTIPVGLGFRSYDRI